MTDTILAAQAFVFFAAGFETSSTTISHTLYEMAMNTGIQDKLRKEIREFHARDNGSFQYEEVKQMKYLDKIFKGTLSYSEFDSDRLLNVKEKLTFVTQKRLESIHQQRF